MTPSAFTPPMISSEVTLVGSNTSAATTMSASVANLKSVVEVSVNEVTTT